jgi:hypothetical protein
MRLWWDPPSRVRHTMVSRPTIHGYGSALMAHTTGGVPTHVIMDKRPDAVASRTPSLVRPSASRPLIVVSLWLRSERRDVWWT